MAISAPGQAPLTGNAYPQPASLADSSRVESLPAPEPDGMPGLSLEAAEAMAMASHPLLSEGSARVQGARGQWLQAGLYPNPVVGYSAEEVGAGGTAGLQGAYISQELVRGGKLPLARAIAAQEVRQSELQLAVQRYRVLNDVRTAFYDTLVAQQAVEITAQLLQVSEQGLQVATNLLRAEEGNRIDVLQASVEADTARIALEQARNRHAASWRQLSAAVGSRELLPMPLTGDLSGDLAELAWESSLAHLLAQSPEMSAAAATVARAEASLRRARVEPIPNVFVQTTVQYDAEGRDTVGNLQLGVPLPIFNKNQGNIRRAGAELAAAHAAVAIVELELQNRLALAFERYANARRQVDTYSQHILPNARTSLELVNTGYRQGEFNYLVVLTTQRTYFQASLAYLNALRELRGSKIAIDGMLLTGGLRGGN
jgi:outer membrane protein, heavy metal efflux system